MLKLYLEFMAYETLFVVQYLHKLIRTNKQAKVYGNIIWMSGRDRVDINKTYVESLNRIFLHLFLLKRGNAILK